MAKVQKCVKCGTADRYANGRCKTCAKNHVKRSRARSRGEGRPALPIPAPPKAAPKRAKGTPKKATQQMNLSESLATSKSRLQFIMARNQDTIEALDREAEMLDEQLEAAKESGTASDVRFLIGERRKLLEARMSYDARLSKDLQAFQELIAADDTETPIEIVIPTPSWEEIVVPSIGDKIDVKDLMPKGAE